MSVIDKINRYIESTRIASAKKCDLVVGEMQAIREIIRRGDTIGAVSLAFDYGVAKGYRLAKREVLSK